jgi:RNA polymerase sigma-70 factor (ECF subfamily)
VLPEEEFRSAWPRVVRVVAAWCGSLDAAEEYAAEAFARLVSSASTTSRPGDVAAWCIQVAKRAYLDDRRRGETFARLAPQLDAGGRQVAAEGHDMDPDDFASALDDRLALLFVACDDALAEGAQLVLALRVVCGLDLGEVADHLGIQRSAAAARLTRASLSSVASAISVA